MVWTIFIIVVLIFLAIDLGLVDKDPHAITTKEATIWSAIWVTLALSFTYGIYLIYGHELVRNFEDLSPTQAAMKYLTAYLIELSLSVDNIFIIAVIFTSFSIPPKYQHKVLFLGILGAIVFRALMIFFGLALIHMFSWIIYVFGAFLIYTAFKMLNINESDYVPQDSAYYKFLRKLFPITKGIFEHRFFIRRNRVFAVTPLFITLMIIELTDVLFALDSIPAVLAISSDPFIIFSSNILAVLGLRSMYFFLANMLEKFDHLHYSLAAILSFVGIKMLGSGYFHFPEWVSLSVILVSLLAGIMASLLKTKNQESD